MGAALKTRPKQKSDPGTIRFPRSLSREELELLLTHIAGRVPHSMGYGVRTENNIIKNKSGCYKQPFIESIYGNITSPDRTLSLHFESDSESAGYVSMKFWFRAGERGNLWPVREHTKDASRLVEKVRAETAKYLAQPRPQ